MKKGFWAIAFVSCALAALAAAAAKDRLYFRGLGFSIAPLEATWASEQYTALLLFLPPSEGFAPNVNVVVQPGEQSIADYAEKTKKELRAIGAKILRDKTSEDAFSCEYTRAFQGRQHHHYSKAELGKKGVYLVTATALESQWKSVGPRLMACVDSFRREKSEE